MSNVRNVFRAWDAALRCATCAMLAACLLAACGGSSDDTPALDAGAAYDASTLDAPHVITDGAPLPDAVIPDAGVLDAFVAVDAHPHAPDAGDDAGVDAGPPSLMLSAFGRTFGIGRNHGCAVVAGAVHCWGSALVGQLGNGASSAPDCSGSCSMAPVRVTGISDARFVAVGFGFTCALREGGRVSCWGQSDRGQLGDGAATHALCNVTSSNPAGTDCATLPVDVALPAPAVQITALSASTCALLETGRVYCWGLGSSGQLGSGRTLFTGCSGECSYTPVPVSGTYDVVELDGGGAFACARRATGEVLCWGAGSTGALGDNRTHRICGDIDCQPAPVTVLGLADAIGVTAGQGHACALRADHTVVCWGSASLGQIGDGADLVTGYDTCTTVIGTMTTGVCAKAPRAVVGISGAVELAAGERHTCARLDDGTVRCWGGSSSGDLGDGTRMHEDCSAVGSAVRRDCARAPVTAMVTGATAMVANGRNTCVRTAAALACWGDNVQFALGDATTHGMCDLTRDCSATPVLVAGLPGVPAP